MIELKGKYNNAKVFTDNIEEQAISQIIELCNQEFIKDSKIAIMPDTHAGKGCTIGTTMTIKDKVVPNLVGVDIGCGMFCVKLSEKTINLNELDEVINNNIPSGQNTRQKNHDYNKYIHIENLRCKNFINLDRARQSVGTLGGGNHFIELNIDSQNNLYLVIHSGSRYLGKQVAEYYQNVAIKYHRNMKDKKAELIATLKKEDRESEIEEALKKMSTPKLNDALCYLEGKDLDDYLHDMNIVQHYAKMNREAIADDIMQALNVTEADSFHTIHNYIDIENKILRKGAISAQDKEVVLIPINMRDGSILARGKGNPEWNYSAPHGAGRILSRSKAKENITIDEFKDSMKEVYTTSVCSATLDEAPMAYKPINEILDNTTDAIEIIDIIKPLYNYKAH